MVSFTEMHRFCSAIMGCTDSKSRVRLYTVQTTIKVGCTDSKHYRIGCTNSKQDVLYNVHTFIPNRIGCTTRKQDGLYYQKTGYAVLPKT
jgi:hypothetical protein